MKIITDVLSHEELKQMAEGLFGNLVKAVVDVEQEIMAVDSQLHADLETHLMQNGSRQTDLWGINLYPDETGDNFVEFDSMINMRPSAGNRSRGVESPEIQQKILAIVQKRVSR